jgi:hypothetical protein
MLNKSGKIRQALTDFAFGFCGAFCTHLNMENDMETFQQPKMNASGDLYS